MTDKAKTFTAYGDLIKQTFRKINGRSVFCLNALKKRLFEIPNLLLHYYNWKIQAMTNVIFHIRSDVICATPTRWRGYPAYWCVSASSLIR